MYCFRGLYTRFSGVHFRGFASRGVQKSSDASAKKKNPYSRSARDVYESSEINDETDVFYPREPLPSSRKSKRDSAAGPSQNEWSDVWRKQDLKTYDYSDNSKESPSASARTGGYFMDRNEQNFTRNERPNEQNKDEEQKRARKLVNRQSEEQRKEGQPRAKDHGWKGGVDRYQEARKEREKEKKKQMHDKRDNNSAWRKDRSEEAQEYQQRESILKATKQQVPRFFDDEEFLEQVERKKPAVQGENLYPPEQRQRKERARESEGYKSSNGRKSSEKYSASSSASSSFSASTDGLRAEDYFEAEETPSASSASFSSPASFSSSSYFRSFETDNNYNQNDNKTNSSPRKNERRKSQEENYPSFSTQENHTKTRDRPQGKIREQSLVFRDEIERERMNGEQEEIHVGKGSWQGGEGKKYNEETGKTEKVRWGARRPKVAEGEVDALTEWENKIGRRFGKRMSNQRVLLDEENKNDDYFSADEDDNIDVTGRERSAATKQKKKKTQELDVQPRFPSRKLKVLRGKDSLEESEDEEEFVPKSRAFPRRMTSSGNRTTEE